MRRSTRRKTAPHRWSAVLRPDLQRWNCSNNSFQSSAAAAVVALLSPVLISSSLRYIPFFSKRLSNSNSNQVILLPNLLDKGKGTSGVCVCFIFDLNSTREFYKEIPFEKKLNVPSLKHTPTPVALRPGPITGGFISVLNFRERKPTFLSLF